MAVLAGNVSTVCPNFTKAIPQADIPPRQKFSAVVAVILDCAGVGKRRGDVSASKTQSAFPAVWALVASNKNFFGIAVVISAVVIALFVVLVSFSLSQEKEIWRYP